jgi:hypothetical protein
MPDELPDLPPTFAATRTALHALAEHVIAPARQRVTGRIGLVAASGGFGTPPFGEDERVRVEGAELVHEHPGSTRRISITTLGDAAHFVGVDFAAINRVYEPQTPLVPEQQLEVDAAASFALGTWYGFATAALEELRNRYVAAAPSHIQLWPEHFDLACDFGDADAGTRANYGASPGDDAIAEPYLYVGPWDASRRTGALGGYGFGAAVTYAELRADGDPRAAARQFFGDAAALLVG